MPKKQAKSQKKNLKQVVAHTVAMKTTVAFGYGILIFAIIGVVMLLGSQTPFLNAGFVTAMDTLIALVVFIIAAVAPFVVGYLAGDSATRSTSKLIHHYNGVLFGVVGVWVWAAVTMVTTYSTWAIYIDSMFRQTLVQLLPAVVTTLVLVIATIAYAKNKRQNDPIAYRPYQWLLAGSVITTVVLMGLAPFFGAQYSVDSFWQSLLIAFILPLTFIGAATLIGYWIVGKKAGTAFTRVSHSLVATGFALTIFMIAVQFMYRIEWASYMTFFSLAVPGAVWLAYLLVQRHISQVASK